MIQRSIHYKSDFKLRLANEIDWSTPFKARFFTTRPVSAMEVSYDGTTYKGCRVDEEGKLVVTFDRFTQLHRQGLGNLMMELSYNIDDDQFADNSFDRILAPQKVVCIDDEDNEFELVLGLNGDSHVEVECSVIAAYKKGDPGDTPEIGENGNWWIGGVDTEVKADYSSEEALRQSQEAARVAAETTRQSNETQRQSGETTRKSNEATRQSKETERQTNETARQNAEAQRQQTFSTNEAARQTAYQNAESNRNGAYEEAEQDRDEEFASKEATRDAANQAALNCAETLAALGPKIDRVEIGQQNVKNYTEFGYILTLSDLPTTGKLQSDGSINEAYTAYKISNFLSLDKVAKLAYHRAEDISSTTGVGLCLYDKDLEVVGSTGWDSTHRELDLTQYPTAKYFRICAQSSAFKCFVAFSNEVTERTRGYFPIGSIDKKCVTYSTGVVSDNTNYILYDVGVKRGISLSFNQYFYDYAGYAFYDKYGDYISGGGLSGTQGSSTTIQAPEYAVRVKISCLRDYLHDFSVKFDLSTMVVEPDDFSVVAKKIENKAVTIQKASFLDIADNVNLIDGWENGFIDADGVPTSNSTLRMTTKVYMSPSHSYYCRNLINGYYAFYGKDDRVLASYANNEGQLGTQPITPPVGTVYGRFTTNNEDYSKRAYIGIADRKGSKMAYVLDESISSRMGSFCNYNGREASMFRKGVAIGDSLTEGVFNTSDGYITDSRYSWPAVFSKLSGVEMTNKGNGGYTSVDWWTAHQNDDLSGYDFAVISLGVNDNSKIGPWDSTIETAFTNIINKLKTENTGIKIFVSTIFPATSYSSVSLSVTFCDAIRTFVAGLNDSNVILLDLQKYAHTRDYTEYNAGHLTALGYSTLAADIYSLISYIIAKNKSVFKDVQFIGTNNLPYNG